MNASTSDTGAPRRILLATDASARGDRALERAIEDGDPAEVIVRVAADSTAKSTLATLPCDALIVRGPPR